MKSLMTDENQMSKELYFFVDNISLGATKNYWQKNFFSWSYTSRQWNISTTPEIHISMTNSPIVATVIKKIIRKPSEGRNKCGRNFSNILPLTFIISSTFMLVLHWSIKQMVQIPEEKSTGERFWKLYLLTDEIC